MRHENPRTETQRSVKGKIVRKVTIEALDMKKGMTAGEMLDCLIQVPGGIVPVMEIRLNGKVKRISFTIEVVPE